jgi:hypothetical protein
MGSYKTYQQKSDRGRLLGESDEFKRMDPPWIRPTETASAPSVTSAISMGVNRLNALPGAIKSVVLTLLDEQDKPGTSRSP